MKSDLVDITAELRHETDKAYLIFDGRTEIKKGETVKSEVRIWVPKSQVEFDNDKTFIMPEWLALEKGFI
jgi:hypothetical protein